MTESRMINTITSERAIKIEIYSTLDEKESVWQGPRSFYLLAVINLFCSNSLLILRQHYSDTEDRHPQSFFAGV